MGNVYQRSRHSRGAEGITFNLHKHENADELLQHLYYMYGPVYPIEESGLRGLSPEQAAAMMCNPKISEIQRAPGCFKDAEFPGTGNKHNQRLKESMIRARSAMESGGGGASAVAKPDACTQTKCPVSICPKVVEAAQVCTQQTVEPAADARVVTRQIIYRDDTFIVERTADGKRKNL